jgi:hypothetical protein
MRAITVLLAAGLAILLLASATSARRHHRRQRPEQMRGDGKLLHPVDEQATLNAWRARQGLSAAAGAFGADISIGLNATSFKVCQQSCRAACNNLEWHATCSQLSFVMSFVMSWLSQCMVEQGFSFVVQRLWRSLCEVDSAAGASIDAAWKGGMSQGEVLEMRHV